MLLLSVFLVLMFEIHSLYKNIVPWLTKDKHLEKKSLAVIMFPCEDLQAHGSFP